MQRKVIVIFLFVSLLFLCSCSLFQDESKIKFDEVENLLELSFGVDGTYNLITEDIDLPTSLKEVSLTWTSDKLGYLSNDGKVTIGENDVVVKLTVELKYDGKIRTLNFEVTIKGEDVVIETYTITFDSKGGSPVASITGVYESVVSKPDDPTKDGYTFLGWFEDELSVDEYVFSTMPNKDLTLYAKWEEQIDESNDAESFFKIYNESLSAMAAIYTYFNTSTWSQWGEFIMYVDQGLNITSYSIKEYYDSSDSNYYYNFSWMMDGFNYKYINQNGVEDASYHESDESDNVSLLNSIPSPNYVVILPYYIINSNYYLSGIYSVKYNSNEKYYNLTYFSETENININYYIDDGRISQITTVLPYEVSVQIYYDSQNLPELFELIDYGFTRNYRIQYIYPDGIIEKSSPVSVLTKSNIYKPNSSARMDKNYIEGLYLDSNFTQKLNIDDSIILEDGLILYIKLINTDKYEYIFELDNPHLGKLLGSGMYFEGESIKVILNYERIYIDYRYDLYEILKENISKHGFSQYRGSVGENVSVSFYAKPKNTHIVIVGNIVIN